MMRMADKALVTCGYCDGAMRRAVTHTLQAVGVARMHDNDKAILVMLRRRPTDDELRYIHELLAGRCMPSHVGDTLTDWLRDNAPDCGDNSCLFGGRGKGGMRTNGGCRCFKDLPTAKRIYVERLFSALSVTHSAIASADGSNREGGEGK